jgi:hypothetical protein
MPEMVPTAKKVFLCASVKVHIHVFKFLLGNRANLNPETLNPSLPHKASREFS